MTNAVFDPEFMQAVNEASDLTQLVFTLVAGVAVFFIGKAIVERIRRRR